MAKIAKSKDTSNYRKGNALQVGDLIAVRYDNHGQPVEFSAIVAYLGKRPYMSVTNHVFELANGSEKLAGGGEFIRGRY